MIVIYLGPTDRAHHSPTSLFRCNFSRVFGMCPMQQDKSGEKRGMASSIAVSIYYEGMYSWLRIHNRVMVLDGRECQCFVIVLEQV